MEEWRFRKPKTAVEEKNLLENTTPKNTQHNTTWAVKVFKEWQLHRLDKKPTAFSLSSISLDITKVQQLDTPLEDMTAETLNLWLSRFIQEVSNQKGERLYLLACGIIYLLNLFDDGISDELLADLDIPEDNAKGNSSSNVNNPIFNNCTVNFWMK